MSTSGKNLKRLFAVALVVSAFAAVVASPAQASVVNAKFSASSLKFTSTELTLKLNGGEAKSCNFQGWPTGTPSGSSAWLSNEQFGYTWIKCSDGTYLKMEMVVSAHFDTVANNYYLTVAPNGSVGTTSPWGTWRQSAEGKANWVNGSGSTQSTLTFEESVLGSTSTGTISLTGTITATTTSGSLITLSH